MFSILHLIAQASIRIIVPAKLNTEVEYVSFYCISFSVTVIDCFFLRRDEDLLMSMDIQLVEALCGFQKPITTLDNRTIIITSHPGKCCFAFC